MKGATITRQVSANKVIYFNISEEQDAYILVTQSRKLSIEVIHKVANINWKLVGSLKPSYSAAFQYALILCGNRLH